MGPPTDRVVRDALGRQRGDRWWIPLRNVLGADPDIAASLRSLRERSGVGDDVSLLRAPDVRIPMAHHGAPEPAPDAEG